MAYIRQILVLFVLSLIKDVHSQAQPCLVCGDAALRIWSLMSRQGDHYLRITSDKKSGSNDFEVDFEGSVESDNHTSLLRVIEKSTISETRIQLVFRRDNKDYHLYAPSTSDELLAMPASQAMTVTDNRNTFAPERLRYEHRLFTVFQSVKFRSYYISCDGSGKTSLKRNINPAYRDPGLLFLTIDPGNAVRGAAFGTAIQLGSRRKREIREDAREATSRTPRSHYYYMHRRKCINPPLFSSRKTTPAPTTPTTITPTEPTPTRPARNSSITTKIDLPDEITFVLCFWIKTQSSSGQLFSLVEHVKKIYGYGHRYWDKRWVYKKLINQNIFKISLCPRFLRIEIGYQRIVRYVPSSNITDNQFHHVCVSYNDLYLLQVYQDGITIFNESLPSVACDFINKPTPKKRQGTFTVGKPKGVGGVCFAGSLYQVNLWDQYPPFRIRRIATNCVCGGGNLLSWATILNSTMSSVRLFDSFECPTLEGYNYDQIRQNQLI